VIMHPAPHAVFIVTARVAAARVVIEQAQET